MCGNVRWYVDVYVYKDCVCTLTPSPGDKSPALSRPSRIYPELWDYETRLASKESFLERGTPRKSVFYIRWKSRIRSTTEGEASSLEKDSWSDGTGLRSDPTNETIRASA